MRKARRGEPVLPVTIKKGKDKIFEKKVIKARPSSLGWRLNSSSRWSNAGKRRFVAGSSLRGEARQKCVAKQKRGNKALRRISSLLSLSTSGVVAEEEAGVRMAASRERMMKMVTVTMARSLWYSPSWVGVDACQGRARPIQEATWREEERESWLVSA